MTKNPIVLPEGTILELHGLKLSCSVAINPGDKILASVMVFPKWWQFWKKPHSKTIEYVCLSTNTSKAA